MCVSLVLHPTHPTTFCISFQFMVADKFQRYQESKMWEWAWRRLLSHSHPQSSASIHWHKFSMRSLPFTSHFCTSPRDEETFWYSPSGNLFPCHVALGILARLLLLKFKRKIRLQVHTTLENLNLKKFLGTPPRSLPRQCSGKEPHSHL